MLKFYAIPRAIAIVMVCLALRRYAVGAGEKDKPESGTEYGQPGAASNGNAPILIPSIPDELTQIDYELTYYLNDVSMQNVQVAMEFGKRSETKNVYTYGNQRIEAERASGTVDEYIYDGRGSVAQVFDGEQISQSLRYDPFGEIVEWSKDNGDALANIYLPEVTFGFNAEEYNPTVGLQYLRARYYAPEIGSFITEDSVLGNQTDINSQNRYSYAHNDPVNNYDPSGHAIGNSSYERMMEAAGSINEIRNFAVGRTLQNNEIAAKSTFNGYLSSARGTDITNLQAVNGISQIPQSIANYYINRGAAMANAVGQTYGCTPGGVVQQAIGAFASNVNVARSSANSQISNVKVQKQRERKAWAREYADWIRAEYKITERCGNEELIANIDWYISKAAADRENELYRWEMANYRYVEEAWLSQQVTRRDVAAEARALGIVPDGLTDDEVLAETDRILAEYLQDGNSSFDPVLLGSIMSKWSMLDYPGQIHRVVQMKIVFENTPGMLYEFPLINGQRLDLYQPGTNLAWEIKPSGSYFLGLTQLQGYISVAATQGIVLTEGLPIFFGTVDMTAFSVNYVSMPGGVVLYEFAVKQPVRVPVPAEEPVRVPAPAYEPEPAYVPVPLRGWELAGAIGLGLLISAGALLEPTPAGDKGSWLSHFGNGSNAG